METSFVYRAVAKPHMIYFVRRESTAWLALALPFALIHPFVMFGVTAIMYMILVALTGTNPHFIEVIKVWRKTSKTHNAMDVKGNYYAA